ncbi:hypothetical protein ONO86_01239 [Micromonospora noduli]|nr:hypothetical protein ONO86_01239 [Micromonospora noduli]
MHRPADGALDGGGCAGCRRHRLPGRRAGQHVVRQRADRVHVGAYVDPSAGDALLGRHVGGRAGDHCEAGRVRERLGQPQIGDQHPVAGRGGVEQHVGGFEVAVQHAAVVQDRHRPGDVGGDPQRRAHRHRPVAQPVGERAASGVRHHQVRPTVGQLTDVQHPDQMIGVDLPHEPGLLAEAPPDVGPLRPVVGEHLHGHRRVQLVVVRQPHGGERTGADGACDAVPANLRRDGHDRIIRPPGLR